VWQLVIHLNIALCQHCNKAIIIIIIIIITKNPQQSTIPKLWVYHGYECTDKYKWEFVERGLQIVQGH